MRRHKPQVPFAEVARTIANILQDFRDRDQFGVEIVLAVGINQRPIRGGGRGIRRRPIRRGGLMSAGTRHTVTGRILAGQYRSPGWRAEGNGVRIRKLHRLRRQLLHVGCFIIL